LDSTKASADVYAPFNGVVTDVNDALADDPGLINESPEELGWMFKVIINL